jgi:hypothetical protein
MDLDDKQRQALYVLLGQIPDDVRDALGRALQKQLYDLKDLNSRFSETQEFLRARGLTHVGQLDVGGTEELFAHLHKVLKKIAS